MNDEQKEELLNIKKDIYRYHEVLAQAINSIHTQDVSNYPILVCHQAEIAMGIPLLSPEDTESHWAISISTLEEFFVKKLISEERISDFQSLYRSNLEKFCLFIFEQQNATFVFLPRKTA